VGHKQLEGGHYIADHEPISSLGDTIISLVSPVGSLFMRLIKMVIAPLVFASLLVGIAGLGDVRKLGRMGSKTLALYLGTTAIAVTIGLTVAFIVKPGNFVGAEDRAALSARFESQAGAKVESAAQAPSAIDNVLSIVPENPIAALTDNNQMLQIIFFAIIFGIALTMLKEERSRQLVSFFDTVQHAMIIIIHMVMAVAPFGVAALLAEAIGNSGVSVLASLLVYSGAVILGLLIHATLVYGGLARFAARIPLRKFLVAIRPAQLLAFSTSSSSATLPVTLECAEENLGISEPVASFVLPMGSTVNMVGTALYQGVAAVFIAQVFGFDLTLGAQLGIVFAATAASIGAAGVPGAGMITLAMVLTTAGIPPEGLALILGVDRLLDMFRTAVNVTGDLAVTAVVAVTEGEKLLPLSSDDDNADSQRGFEGRLKGKAHAVRPDDSA
jgi:Na+/H+-dicarboxylate symporter